MPIAHKSKQYGFSLYRARLDLESTLFLLGHTSLVKRHLELSQRSRQTQLCSMTPSTRSVTSPSDKESPWYVLFPHTSTAISNISFGQKEKGQLGEYSVSLWKKVVPIPDSVSLRDAAATTAQGYTALAFAEEAYEIKPGDIIFIHTVAGGLGMVLTQVAKLRGATVIGTTSTAEKAKIAKENGADHVILYKNEDVVKRVLEITNGEGVHVTYDGVGKDG